MEQIRSDQRTISLRAMIGMILFTAIVIVLQILGGVISAGFFSVTLVLLPIVMGAALYGPGVGAWLGFVFGIVVVLAGDADAIIAQNPVVAILLALSKGALAGYAAGLVYKAFSGRSLVLATALAAFVCPVVNSGIFLLGMSCFRSTVAEWSAARGYDSVASFLITDLVGSNFLLELILNMVLSPVIMIMIQSVQKRLGRGELHLSLSEKMYLLITWIILVLSVLMIFTSYNQYCKKVDDYNFEQARRCAEGTASVIPADYIENLWNNIRTDEFQKVHKEAEAANDKRIIVNWMIRQPAVDPKTYPFTLYEEYMEMVRSCERAKNFSEVKDVYVQCTKDEIAYNLIDPNEDIFYLGSLEEPDGFFAGFDDNEKVPPVIYVSPEGLEQLYVACEPIISDHDGHPVGLACVDVDMNQVIQERKEFVVHSLLFILLELVIAVVISMILMHFTVTRPMGMLTRAAKNFGISDTGYAKEDVIDLPIDSHDEIGDLYQEIRSMQSRIVDNTRRLTQITAEKERFETELKLASTIQETMLPNEFPPYPDRSEFEIYASMDPAKAVGGDFYNFFLIDEDHLGIVMADVSGKGIPAALFMMKATIIISQNAKVGKSPAQILEDANKEVCRNNPMQLFVTVWAGILEISTGRLVAANAGHEYPVLKDPDGRFELVKDKHGFVIGGMEEMKYREYEWQLKPGAKLFLYTDGVTEATTVEDELFGVERMLDALNEDADAAPDQLLRNVRGAVNRFVKDAEQFDDLTMLCIEYKGKSDS